MGGCINERTQRLYNAHVGVVVREGKWSTGFVRFWRIGASSHGRVACCWLSDPSHSLHSLSHIGFPQRSLFIFISILVTLSHSPWRMIWLWKEISYACNKPLYPKPGYSPGTWPYRTWSFRYGSFPYVSWKSIDRHTILSKTSIGSFPNFQVRALKSYCVKYGLILPGIRIDNKGRSRIFDIFRSPWYWSGCMCPKKMVFFREPRVFHRS